MQHAAFVVYVEPKSAATGTIWCLERLGCRTSLAYLFERLHTFFGGRFGHLVTSDAAETDTLWRSIAELTLQDVTCFAAAGVGKLRVLHELAQCNPAMETLLVFPEGSLFVDCELTDALFKHHLQHKLDATMIDPYPPGLCPEIIGTRPLARVVEMGIPPGIGDRPVDVMLTANRLLGHDGEFRVQPAGRCPFSRDIARLPWRVLISDSRTFAAASAVLKNPSYRSDPGALAAMAFKRRLGRAASVNEGRGIPCAIRPPAERRVTVLFSTLATGFAGAEESMHLLIRHLHRSQYQPIVVLPKSGVLAQKLQEAGIRPLLIGYDFGALNPSNVSLFQSIIQARGVQIVHMDSIPIPALTVAAHYCGVPIVTHVRIFYGPSAPDVLRFSTALIAVSDAVRRDILRGEFDPRRVHTIYNGIDLREFSRAREISDVRACLGIERSARVVSLVGRICAQKRQDFLIRALPEVLARAPELQVLLVGEAYALEYPYLNFLKELITQQRLERHIRFIPFQRDVRPIYAASNAAVLCTINEPFGRAVIEAMAMGVPVVVPKSGGPGEIVRHGRDGLLYDPDNTASFSRELLKVLTDPALERELARKGRKRAACFSISKHVQSVEALYRSILTGASRC